MRQIIFIIGLLFYQSQAYSQQTRTGITNFNLADSIASLVKPPEFAIIPEPVSLNRKQGQFQLPEQISIQAAEGSRGVVDYLKTKLTIPTGRYISETSSAGPATIKLVLNTHQNTQLGKEGYLLSVKPQGITITANENAGLFYGVQSLLQLFPTDIDSKVEILSQKWTIPAVEITDYPRVAWRGLMFDVARHFFTKAEVKQYIDAMVRYKFNILHLHLADDEGWRIEIKGLPKLTEVGAWNVKKTGNFGTFSPAGLDEPRTYGGFYTQEDIKELVNYAKERFVEIMPEIDVPGHSLAIIASYPELSCTPGAENYRVRSGERIMDWSRGTPPLALVDNTLCPANEQVYRFLDTVITQIATLFPFQYIHMGGDEAAYNFWQKSEAVKALMVKEGLKDMHQVQGYFGKRVQQIVESKGKKFMGWDEILNENMPPSAAIMSWRNTSYGIGASRNKHEVVMAPQDFVYLDQMQGDRIVEPKVYNSVFLSKTYQFDPVPEGADPKYILGGQGNLWTEQIYTMRHAEYMTWPRGLALAESVWSPKTKKNWLNFTAKMEQHFERMDLRETKYAVSVFEPIFRTNRAPDGQIMVDLQTEIADLDMYYSFDNSYPDHFYPRYTDKLLVPKDAQQLRVISYRNKKPVGRMITISTEELRKRVGKK